MTEGKHESEKLGALPMMPQTLKMRVSLQKPLGKEIKHHQTRGEVRCNGVDHERDGNSGRRSAC